MTSGGHALWSIFPKHKKILARTISDKWREFEDSASKTVVCRLATDRQTHTHTHTHTQTHTHTDRHTHRQTDRTDYMIVANLRLATINRGQYITWLRGRVLRDTEYIDKYNC